MKYLYIYTLLLVMLSGSFEALHAEKEVSYLSKIGIRDQEVVKNNREVQLSMKVDLSELKIRTQHTVALIPVLVSEDGSREATFPPIVIDGKTRNRVYLRAQHLESVDLPPFHDDASKVIIRRHNGKEQTYDYSAATPYERWMLNGRIEIREQVHGCENCAEGNSDRTLLGTVLPEFIPHYRIDSIAPDPEPVKVRAETRTARLQFRQNSRRIDPNFKNNRAELDTVSHSILLVKDNPDVFITGIYIFGYASPEGSVPYNLNLSKERVQALAAYISKREHIDADLLHVEGKGEDWDGFRRALEQFPQLLKRDEVYRIIDNCKGDRDLCEEQLQKLYPPAIYQRLLNEVYPLLRRVEYSIVYNVRNFDIEEVRRLVEERPDLLSQEELYKLADTYDKESAEYKEIMQVASRYFPESPATINRLALEAMAAGDYAEAIQRLEGAGITAHNASLLNTLGVAYAGAGDPYKAQEMFRRAAQNGSAGARHNQTQIQKIIDQL